uniref:syndecan-2 isoform X1 n=1 Tax=Ciona intestinalis TaxID=7719 RepID=UPI000180C2F2|nr:syndecan-2 isoform X1 [Ciona intestinalis]|eukprot:XP_026696262.1 syndecan-2 isoform X1 [Ciona intestinalis]
MLKKIGIVLLLVHLFQVNGQYSDNNKEFEGSGETTVDTIITDDEDMIDMMEGSTSGHMDLPSYDDELFLVHSLNKNLNFSTLATPTTGMNEVTTTIVRDTPPSLEKETWDEEPEVILESTPPLSGHKDKEEIGEVPVKSKFDVEPSEMGDGDNVEVKDNEDGEVLSEKPSDPKKTVSFAQSSQLMAALIIGGCVGLLFAVCVIMLLAYRMRKKDEGSYALDEQKKPASPSAYQYSQGQEYYA